MANVSFTFFDDVTVTSSSISGSGVHTVLTSPIINNATDFTSLKAVVEYRNIDPDFGNDPQTFFIDAFIEAQSENLPTKWYPVAYQFSSFRNTLQGEKRIILLQPSISTFDSGIDDVVFVGDREIARISRQQGKLAKKFRCKILINETSPQASGSFKSVMIDAYGEMFNA